MKILVDRAGAIGDVILTTGVVRALKQKYPDAEIDVETQHPYIFKHNPYVNHAGGNHSRRDYDQYIDLNLAYELKPYLHPIDAYAERAGVDAAACRPELFPQDTDRAVLDRFKIPEKFVAVHMRKHFWPNRNLPPDFWIELISYIIGYTDYSVVQIGEGNDLHFDGIDPRIIDYVGKFNLFQTMSLIQRSSAYVGVDAGTLHIAACTDVPILGFYTAVKAEYREPRGRTAPHINVAANIDCYGCVEKLPVPLTQYHCGRGDEACTRSFDAKQVFEQLKTLL